jgi:hypothetical protein|tara:strand:+ start:404 stop:925 length:522 start_codon:yes stop_codon:yes gene_type:complete
MRALIVDNLVVEFPSDFLKLRMRHKNTSFPKPVTDEEYEALGLFRVAVADEPAHNKSTHRAVEKPTPDIEKGRPVLNYDVAALTSEESEARILRLWGNLREGRNSILSKTDHLMLRDSPLTADQMSEATAYRQALRELPANISDINTVKNIDLPVKPEFVAVDDDAIFNLRYI